MATEVETFEIQPEIIVQAFDVETTLEAFSLNEIEEFYIEYGGVTDPLGQLASAVMGFIESVVSSAESAIRSAIYSIEGSIKSVISGVESAIKSAIGGVKSAILSAISGVQSLVRSVLSTVQSIGSSILSSIGNAISTITSTISSIGKSVISTVQGIASSIQNVLSNFQKTITNFIQNISAQIQSTLTSITQSIQSISQSILSTLQSISTTIQNTLQNIFNQIQSVLANLSKTMQNISQTITSTIQNISTTLQNTIQNLSQTINQIAMSITSTLQSISQTITSGFQTFLSQLGNVLTQVQNMIQGVVQNIQNVATSISKTIQNVFTNIQTFLDNLSTTITSTIQGISQTIQTMFTPIINAIDWIRQQVTKIPELPSLIWQLIQQNIVQPLEEHVVKPIKAFFEDLWNEHIKPFFDKLKDIPSKMAEISKAFQGFINPLVGIAQFFDQIRQKFIDFITNIPNYIKAIADFFGDIAKDPLGWFNKNVVKPLADAFSAIGKWIWEYLPDWLKNAITTAQDWFSDAKDWITKKWKDFVDWVSKIPEHIQNLGNYIYDNAIKPLQDWFNENVVKPLSEVFKPVSDTFDVIEDRMREFSEDPIGAVSTFLQNVWNAIKDSLSSIVEGILTFLGNLASSILNATKNIATSVFNTTTSFLSEIAKGVLSGLWRTLSGMMNASKSLWEQVGKFLSGIIEGTFETIYKNVAKPIEKAVMDLIKRITTGAERGQIVETFELLGLTMVTFIGSEYLQRGLQITLRKLAGIFNAYQKKFTIRVRGRGEAKGEPVGVGAGASAGGGGGFEYTMTFNLGYPLRKIADEMQKYADEYRRGIIYGMTIWASQPMMRLACATWRNVMPVELPSLAEMRDITRRYMPIKEKFEEHLNVMRRYLALYGYNDEVISWLTTPITEEGWFITIKDRFAYDRSIPISLLYELPTPSDFCRMMIHDIIMHPDYFTQVMQMKGYNDDVAMMYYLLHFRYPTLEKLWEFYCRARADMLWLDRDALPEIVTKEEEDIIKKYGIGEIPIYPAELNVSRNPNAPQTIMNAIKLYAKWWDYAFFNWFKKEGIKFPSDRLIMLDLMAEIPQRIDARWMYKWSIIKDVDLMKIVTARGMHPKWVETITIAECMNALAEERTYARTGVINAFKEGFMPLDGLNKTLSHLTDVKILGKDIPVRFLEGEVKLLTLRAKYDRALDILRDYFKELLWSVSENIIPFDGMTKALKEEISAIAKELGLSNLALDESYYKLYQPVVESYKKIRTIDRIRYWTRYMLYRLLQRFSEGFMSREEFEGMINDIVERGKLTEEEREYFMTIAQFMYDGFYKKALADGILKKLSRGAISEEEARKRLIELGLTNDIVDALIEKYAKTYTLSISTLLSYADEVYIPEELLLRKLEILGVPEDEKKIVLQVFRIRPIKDELAKAVRSEIDRFIEGYIDEATLRESLKKLGKMQKEIDLIVQYAKIEKSMEINKLRIDAILNKLRRGAISMEDAMKELRKYIADVEVINALIEKYVKTYQLSISTLLSYADEVMIPESLLEKKMELLGVPKDERDIIKQVFKIRPIKDELSKVIRELIDSYIDGYIDKTTLTNKLKSLGKRDEEIRLIVYFADLEKLMEINKLKVKAILNKLRRGAITIDLAKTELMKIIKDETIVDALIEENVRTYTLSISQLISYAEYVDIPEEFVKRKLEILGVPEDEIPIILQVFKIRPLKDERAKMIRSVIDAYIDGLISKELFQKNLLNLGESPREVQILTEFADFEKSQKTAKLMIDAILNRLRRGAITVEQAKEELGKIIVDKALVDAMIEKYVRTYVWSPDKLVSMGEYVPIDIRKLVEKASMYGYPEEEVKLYPAYLLARNLSEEIGRIVTELVYLYVYDIIDEETLRKEIDRVRTLNGEVKKFGVDWIVIDDMEKELIIHRAKLRKMREQGTS